MRPKSRHGAGAPFVVTPSKTVTRRKFLRDAALAAGSLSLGSALWPGRALGTGINETCSFNPNPANPLGTLPNPNQAPVEHIIVLMNENRSFDHYFGWRTGTNVRTYPDPDNGGNPVTTRHLAPDHPYRGCGHPDPGHGWDAGRAQLTGGFLAGANDEFAISYYLPEDVELYSKLARQFTLCDNYFCSLLGPTFPNREYMHSAQSGGLITNALPPEEGYPTGFPWCTIWDRLEAAGVPWAYYFVDLPAILLWGGRLARGVRHIEDFYADAYAGTLPNVVFVDPGFTTGLRTDEHPYSDIRAGQAFAHNVVKSVLESPLWKRSALFINYDEWGGFFDHVRPPRAVDERGNPDDIDQDFGQLGFRVPSLIISPYARRGELATQVLGIEPEGDPSGPFFVEPPSVVYEHCSILKFIEWRFGLEPLTDRDANAANIGALLDFDQAPRLDVAEIVEALPRSLVTSEPCRDEELEGAVVDGVIRDVNEATGTPWPFEPTYEPRDEVKTAREEVADAFQHALESGYFESMGWDGKLPTLKTVLGG